MRDHHTLHTIETALWVLAFANGNTSQAVRELEAIGISIERTTLSYWKRVSHRDRYAQIEAEATGQVRTQVAAEMMRLGGATFRASIER